MKITTLLYVKDSIPVLIIFLFSFSVLANTIQKHDTIKTENTESYLFFINSLNLNLNKNGIINNGKFNNIPVLYSGGFSLSGFDEHGHLWANGVGESSGRLHYLAGTVETSPEDVKSRVYIVKKEDLDFGDSWNNWRDAVEIGAYYYDGDNDGVYNPEDKNNNGKWDLNEDKPDLLGDETVWCVFNDGVLAENRNFGKPQGIEIRQTVWAYSDKIDLDSAVFIRYSILNTGLISQIHDSVYFGIWSDTDIGSYVYDELAGCDTLLNAGYTYNADVDNEYGNNPPCVVAMLLQGPLTLGSRQEIGFNRMGDLGIDTLYNSKNLGLSSFANILSGTFLHDTPFNELQQRYVLMGRKLNGNLHNPCDTLFAKVFGMECSEVDSSFLYSGDPIQPFGWNNTRQEENRIFTNTGPFKLEMGKPVDIIVAYIIGRGKNSLSSVSVAKQIASRVQAFYESNFTEYPVVSVNMRSNIIPTEYILNQNYPNPFNPTTTIRYSIPANVASSFSLRNVTLKVYDILGREVQTLINKQQKSGNYEVTFDASSLSSGVYYYQLNSGDFVRAKKMILMK